MNEGRLLDAIRAYRKAAALGDGDPGTLLELAQLYERHELVPDAKQLYADLAAANPSHTQFAQKRGQFAALRQDAGRASGLAERAHRARRRAG